MNPELPVIDDTPVWDAWLGLYQTPVISVALELEVFESLREPADTTALAERTGYTVRGLSALLGMLKCLGAMEEDDAFNTSFIVSIICTIIAPVNAEMNLDCNTAHGAVYVLFPILLGAHALAM